MAKIPSKQEGSNDLNRCDSAGYLASFFLVNSDHPFFEKDFILNRERMKTYNSFGV